MTIPEYEKNRKYFLALAVLFLGAFLGILASPGFHREQDEEKMDVVETEEKTDVVEINVPETEEKIDVVETNVPETEGIDLIVAYPFAYSLEGWQLVLHEDGTENSSDHTHSGREFRLYNENGDLVQTFPCVLEAKELIFQYDHLFYYYGFDKDLVVFPSDASETGTKGLCYPWEDETKKFSENPVEIPWYEKSSNDTAFLTTETKGDTVTKTICRINEESRQVVELRKWTLTGEKQEGKGTLQIEDCLVGQDIYQGEVERNVLGNLVNDKYYQYLFWQNLETFWKWTDDNEIEIAKMTHGSYERVTYQSREELLADCGFQGKEPFYEYYDSFHRLELELFFDEQTGRGCGILYGYHYNYSLEQVRSCRGFAFKQVTTKKWEPEDTFSTLSIDGEDARKNNVSEYSEIYEYTDDGKLSSFESRGTIVDYGEEKGEDKLLSMDYVYRNDGTLYYKHYYHHHILFGSTQMTQDCHYDEQGRITCNYSYVTHGSYSYYYIYKDDSEKPAYCLMLDSPETLPEMIFYGN